MVTLLRRNLTRGRCERGWRAGPLPPGRTTFLLLGGSKTSGGALPLPLDLGVLGMAGCKVLISGDQTFPVTNVAGLALWTVPLANNPGLLGARFYTQGLVLDPGTNILGAIVSNAGEAVIGS